MSEVFLVIKNIHKNEIETTSRRLMAKPLLFLVQMPEGDIGRIDDADDDAGESAESRKERFDRLFMIKKDMTREEKIAARADLDAIYHEVKQNASSSKALGSAPFVTVLGEEAKSAKRKLNDSPEAKSPKSPRQLSQVGIATPYDIGTTFA